MTAAHCICPDEHKKHKTDDGIHFQHPHPKSLCKKPYDHRNQITPGVNDITIYGGHKNIDGFEDRENAEYRFSTEHAFIKNGPSSVPPYQIESKDDIGLLVSDRVLFDMNTLKNVEPLDTPPIIPICLAAEDTDFSNEKITGVGWGLVYDESPTRTSNQDPYYSSCMTNEVGPEKWAFEHCDMNWIKNEIRVTDKITKEAWSCDKTNYPDKIKKDVDKCRFYFLAAKTILDGTQIRVMENVDKIHIHENKIDFNNPFLTCYKERQFRENGWCKIRSSSFKWGFCSPSCDGNLLKV